MIPLNQTYRQKQTFYDYPPIEKIYHEYINWALNSVKWHKYGRAYDCSISLHNIDFSEKVVCELGARDSIFSAYLTKIAKTVYASDYFIDWEGLGDIATWNKIWKNFSDSPDKHISQTQDMRHTTYPDNFFDIVLSFSAIEHIKEGDSNAAKEMARICKPGGTIIIGTDMCHSHKWHAGGYFYDKESLFSRIIQPSGCKLLGNYDFSMNCDTTFTTDGLEYASAILFLTKT